MDNILSMMGLALRAGRLEVGEEPVGAACRARDCRLLLVAADAAEGSLRRAERFAQAGDCLLAALPHTKEALGAALGRTVCGMAAVTDIGFAEAIARKLSAVDPAQYGPILERLEVKAQRAAQRRQEQRAHDRNIKKGKKKLRS